MKLTKAQKRYLENVTDAPHGTRPYNPPAKRMFTRLTAMGLIELTRVMGIGKSSAAFYARTEAGRTALTESNR